MNNIKLLVKKEVADFFRSPVGFVILVVFLSLTSWLFFQSFFLIAEAEIRGFFDLLPFVFLFLAPAISMRSFAEENRSGTIEILLTLPLTDIEVVVGKFLSGLSMLAITLAVSFVLPVTVGALGALDWGQVVAGYLGALFLGACFLSLGNFLSLLTKSQIVAFILVAFFNFLVSVIGQTFILEQIPSGLASVVSFLSPTSHFTTFTKGVIDLRDIVYFASYLTVFLLVTLKALRNKRV